MARFVFSASLCLLMALCCVSQGNATVLDTSDPDFVLWLKADVGVEEANGDPAENGDAVSRWLDQSGKNNHVTQGTVANRPTYTAVDGLINNQPSVSFAEHACELLARPCSHPPVRIVAELKQPLDDRNPGVLWRALRARYPHGWGAVSHRRQDPHHCRDELRSAR